jgi:hypothetical protein
MAVEKSPVEVDLLKAAARVFRRRRREREWVRVEREKQPKYEAPPLSPWMRRGSSMTGGAPYPPTKARPPRSAMSSSPQWSRWK